MWTNWRPVHVDSLEAGLCGPPGGWSMQTPWRPVHVDPLEAGLQWMELEPGCCPFAVSGLALLQSSMHCKTKLSCI